MIFTLGLILLSIALTAFSISLGGIIYQHLVEFPNWSANLPASLHNYRAFFNKADFGDFFKVFMSASTICLVISLFILWNLPPAANKWMLMALAGIFITAGFTSKYFVPKHEALFNNNIDDRPMPELEIITRQWRKGNMIRILIMFVTVFAFFKALVMVL